jgi:peroxiredoxin Q/BCP
MNTVTRVVLLGGVLGLLTLTGARGADDKTTDPPAGPVDLKVGDVAPTFECLDDEGRPWKSAEHVGKKYLVVYFYPGDFTPGCTNQAKGFRDAMHKLVEKGVEVVGVSGDAVLNHQLFKEAQTLNFTLLADEDGSIAKKFGVPLGAAGQVKTKGANGQEIVLKRGVTAARWTFVIDKDGKIALKNTRALPTQDAKKVAEFIDQLEKR